MIEIKHAFKTYTTKTGVSTTAINDISFKLPNTGMVFLVGKSGAGKSTLLNVLGGLDYLDSGEIIVNGKSTKDFSKSEYDSYRNTYVGFVFQNFHIIDSLSIGENIALAIKLQNKKPNKDLVGFILDEVGLDGYMDRWPNELSGGQLQRVAIARALIKKPQIIIADEPTGSLDSKTGEQIFDTLKLLSRTHLVLVVSHDLDFARQYADRIIEIKDGKVINDIEKIINKKTKKEKFATTKDKMVASEDHPLNLIKSKMPWKEATRMGSSALLHKKLRLAASIFLSVVSFTMLGLSAIIGFYNDADVCSRTYAQYPVIDFAHYAKTLITTNSELDPQQEGYFNEEDKQTLENAVGVPFTILNEIDTDLYANLNLSREEKARFDIHYANHIYNTTYIHEDKLSEFNIDIIAGQAPKDTNEIAITKYIWETFEKYKYYDGTQEIPVPKPENIIGHTLTLHEVKYKITAVYDTHFDNHNPFFDKVWRKVEPDPIRNADGYEQYSDYKTTLAGTIFVNSEQSGKEKNKSQTIIGVIKNKKNNSSVNKMYNFAFAKHDATKQDKIDHPYYEYAQYNLLDSVTDSALSTINRASFLRQIFLYFGIAFVVFSGLLLGNFIANSISYQRKEIGILRAIGARSVDIFKIYSVESMIISLINFAISVLTTFLVFNFAFGPILMEGSSGVILYSFSFLPVLLIFVVSLVSAFIATYIPVKLATRQKPIDAIRLK